MPELCRIGATSGAEFSAFKDWRSHKPQSETEKKNACACVVSRRARDRCAAWTVGPAAEPRSLASLSCLVLFFLLNMKTQVPPYPLPPSSCHCIHPLPLHLPMRISPARRVVMPPTAHLHLRPLPDKWQLLEQQSSLTWQSAPSPTHTLQCPSTQRPSQHWFGSPG